MPVFLLMLQQQQYEEALMVVMKYMNRACFHLVVRQHTHTTPSAPARDSLNDKYQILLF